MEALRCSRTEERASPTNSWNWLPKTFSGISEPCLQMGKMSCPFKI